MFGSARTLKVCQGDARRGSPNVRNGSRGSRDIRDRSAHRPTSVDLNAVFGSRSAPIPNVDQKIISMQTSHCLYPHQKTW